MNVLVNVISVILWLQLTAPTSPLISLVMTKLEEKFLSSVLMILTSHCFFQLSRNSSWHGTPGKHVVCCNHHHVSQGSLLNCEYHVDATSNRAVLQRLDSAKSYNVFIKMCNKEQFCSAGGEPYVVEELPGGLRK